MTARKPIMALGGPPLSVNLDGAAPQRGDLVFWSGHVAIVRDRSRGCRCSTLLVSRLVSSRPNEVTKEQGGRQASRSAGSV